MDSLELFYCLIISFLILRNIQNKAKIHLSGSDKIGNRLV